MTVAIVGAGLAGSLLALALVERGQAVTLVDGGQASAATLLSYGVLMPGADRPWRRLQRRHGDLGLRPLPVRQVGRPWLPALPLYRLDGERLALQLPEALARAGVVCLPASLRQPPQPCRRGWHLALAVERPVDPLEAEQVVLAAGAGCRALWPQLPAALWVSWAGVLELERLPPPLERARDLPRDGALLPVAFDRLALERRAAQLVAEAWVVDPGLVPRGSGWLAGQISLVRPAPAGGGPAPDSAVMEARLRQGLASAPAPLASLASWPGRYRQAPVSFCLDGRPLVGPVAGSPGLWVCAGFSGAYSQVPAAVQTLATRMVGG